MFYAGIGSRETPPNIQEKMTQIARMLSENGYILRSGGARGADTAFERGAQEGKKEIYLPWKGFENNPSPLYTITLDALILANRYHPLPLFSGGALNMKKLTALQKFMARNCYQVLGYELNSPSHFVLCWTPDGSTGESTTRKTGGTGQAIRLAFALGIPVFNMARPDCADQFWAWWTKQERTT